MTDLEPSERVDSLSVIRHWIVRMPGYGPLVIDGDDAEERAESYRNRYPLEGPFVDASTYQGAVDLLREAADLLRTADFVTSAADRRRDEWLRRLATFPGGQ